MIQPRKKRDLRGDSLFGETGCGLVEELGVCQWHLRTRGLKEGSWPFSGLGKHLLEKSANEGIVGGLTKRELVDVVQQREHLLRKPVDQGRVGELLLQLPDLLPLFLLLPRQAPREELHHQVKQGPEVIPTTKFCRLVRVQGSVPSGPPKPSIAAGLFDATILIAEPP